MTELKPEERKALIEALENGVPADHKLPKWAIAYGGTHAQWLDGEVPILSELGVLFAQECKQVDELVRVNKLQKLTIEGVCAKRNQLANAIEETVALVTRKAKEAFEDE